jgi:hypothetical protein
MTETFLTDTFLSSIVNVNGNRPLTAAGELFIAWGWEDNIMWESTDGLVWMSHATTLPDPVNFAFPAIAAIDGGDLMATMMINSSSLDDSMTQKVFTSTDRGVTWTEAIQANSTISDSDLNQWHGLMSNGTSFVAWGRSDQELFVSGQSNLIWSTDGVTWNEQRLGDGTEQMIFEYGSCIYLPTTNFSPGTYYIFRYEDPFGPTPDAFNDYYESTDDGANWTLHALPTPLVPGTDVVGLAKQALGIYHEPYGDRLVLWGITTHGDWNTLRFWLNEGGGWGTPFQPTLDGSPMAAEIYEIGYDGLRYWADSYVQSVGQRVLWSDDPSLIEWHTATPVYFPATDITSEFYGRLMGSIQGSQHAVFAQNITGTIMAESTLEPCFTLVTGTGVISPL